MSSVVVLGSEGMLGAALLRQLENHPGFTVRGFSHAQLDVLDADALERVFKSDHPEVVWNCIAYNNVDAAESHQQEASVLNGDFPGHLANLCKENKTTLVHFSSGYVFDGQSESGYDEDAQPNPLGVYGQSKLAGEQKIQAVLPAHYIIRLNWLFGVSGRSARSKQSFPDTVLRLAAAATGDSQSLKPLRMVNDEIASPTYAEDLAALSIGLIQDNQPYGIYHGCNDGQASWYDFAVETLRINKINVKVEPISSESLVRAAKRPKHCILNNTKLPAERDWHEALAAYYTTQA